VHTLEELATFSSRVDPEQRRKRHLAEPLPHAPGVYLFRDARDRVLYVGTSKDLRRRVRSYFTASETRSRMGEMVRLAESVEGIVCATPLEAEVRELRLIGEHKPRYNRRSRHPERVLWLKLTREPWPRLSLVRSVLDDGADYVGPFNGRRTAERAMAAAHDAFAVRQCTGRLPRSPSQSACVLAEMGRCLSPCNGAVDADAYAAEVARLRRALLLDPSPVVSAADRRMQSLSSTERYEEASVLRDRLAAFVRATARTQRLSALTRLPQLVAARQQEDRSWEIHVVRHGRLAAAAVMRGGVSAPDFVATVVAGAETVPAGLGPAPAASASETECALRWLEQPGVRLIQIEGTWCSPVSGAGGRLATHDAAESARTSLVPFDERRSLRTVHQP
jgi:DNA polymerase-3 subunit epsilon